MQRNFSAQELVNKTFHWLTLKKEIRKPTRNGSTTVIYWECECVCGKRVIRREDTIREGKTKSCGCKHPRTLKGKDNPSWEGVGDLNGQYYSQLKHGSKVRGIKFEVTKEYLWELFLKQDRKCALTGLPINIETLKNKIAGLEQAASLDRIDPNQDYVEGNVQWVHKDINRMKSKYKEGYFVEMCCLIADRHREKQLQEELAAA